MEIVVLFGINAMVHYEMTLFEMNEEKDLLCRRSQLIFVNSLAHFFVRQPNGADQRQRTLFGYVTRIILFNV